MGCTLMHTDVNQCVPFSLNFQMEWCQQGTNENILITMHQMFPITILFGREFLKDLTSARFYYFTICQHASAFVQNFEQLSEVDLPCS